MPETTPRRRTSCNRLSLTGWQHSAIGTETTLHQLSPYIGKIKSSIAASLVSQFSNTGDVIYDPFSGSGTVALEAWIAERHAIATDLSPYAFLLTKAKLFPYASADCALDDIDGLSKRAEQAIARVDLRVVPTWVRSFFDAETLRAIIAWTHVLRASRRDFLLACLLGILHHQRPGFLSYPSSHTVPYLRSNKFPLAHFPELYEYRDLRSRLEAKVKRALKRVPSVNFDLERECYSKNAATFLPKITVNSIITSPPYMRSLDYARDNRLRLWFLGANDWQALDSMISPREVAFINLIRCCFKRWRDLLQKNAHCIIISGDRFSRLYRASISHAITTIATREVGGYELRDTYREKIPDKRRVRRDCAGNLYETILVFRRR